jgi:lipopolysaccharide transport system ATP-binding protein
MGGLAVELDHVSKAYRIYAHPRHRLLEAVWRGRRKLHQEFWALRDVSVHVPPGSTLGIIGMNGSGKSTLLQVIAGIVHPTAGTVHVTGRIASLLELGAGFSPEFTGRENVFMHGAILGLSRDAVEARFPAIEAFAEIGDFIDRPVKTYSSGMFVRLAFAAAIHVDPDVLLVDEALSVGDVVFQHRCIRRIREFQDAGKTILFVSHDLGTVKAICSQVLFLDAGSVRAIGEPAEVASLYHAHVATLEARHLAGHAPSGPAGAVHPSGTFRPDPEFDHRVALFRHGSGGARIRNVETLDVEERPVAAAAFDQEVVLRVHARFEEPVSFYVLGFFLRDKNGSEIVGTNTHEEGVVLPSRGPGDTLVVDFRLRLPLMPGSYSVTTALAYSPIVTAYLDWVDNAAVVEVLPPPDKRIHGKVALPVQIVVHP